MSIVKLENEEFFVRCKFHGAPFSNGYIDISLPGCMIVHLNISKSFAIAFLFSNPDYITFDSIIKDSFFDIKGEFLFSDIIKNRMKFKICDR